jgi:DNA-binding XRE family transcriptional regulator
MEAIKANIECYIDGHATTKDAIAQAMGISRSSLYDKLSGKRPWMLSEVIDLARFMNCTVNDLLNMPTTTCQ